MKKKVVSGLFVVLFIGSVGFFTVSDAVGNQENDWTNTFKMGRGYEQHRGAMNQERSQSERNNARIQKKWQESTNTPYTRREESNRNHINDSRRNNSRMSPSCW